jgi:tripartite-type tricarboxylate transporter receptor subunit TctC
MIKTLLATVSALILTLANQAVAQDWPQKPIRIIVSFGPGGGADIIGRILADSMQIRLGKPVVVENKPGAGGIIGNEAVANAEPDGYTLGIMTAGQIIAAITRKNMRYDTLTAFAPVGQIATASLLIVTRPDFPANNVKELVAAAKADPGKIVFASPGFAATQHFAGEMFKQAAKVNLLHVPFKTSPEAINATLGKHADVLFDTAQGARCNRQGALSRSSRRAASDRIRRTSGLRRNDVVWRVCAPGHACIGHRQAQPGAE